MQSLLYDFQQLAFDPPTQHDLEWCLPQSLLGHRLLLSLPIDVADWRRCSKVLKVEVRGCWARQRARLEDWKWHFVNRWLVEPLRCSHLSLWMQHHRVVSQVVSQAKLLLSWKEIQSLPFGVASLPPLPHRIPRPPPHLTPPLHHSPRSHQMPHDSYSPQSPLLLLRPLVLAILPEQSMAWWALLPLLNHHSPHLPRNPLHSYLHSLPLPSCRCQPSNVASSLSW